MFCVFCCLKYLLASISWESYGVLNNDWAQIVSCILLLCVFLWGRFSQTCQARRPQSNLVIPRRACRHDCECHCALEANRFKSWSYGLLLIIWNLMCIFSILCDIMRLFRFIRREELVRAGLFGCNKRERRLLLKTKRCSEELFVLWCMGATRLTKRASFTLRKAIAY